MSVFAMNGFGDLQSFCEIREADLDYMGIMAPEQRAKILAAVQVMHDYQCEYLYRLILRLSSTLLYAVIVSILLLLLLILLFLFVQQRPKMILAAPMRTKQIRAATTLKKPPTVNERTTPEPTLPSRSLHQNRVSLPTTVTTLPYRHLSIVRRHQNLATPSTFPPPPNQTRVLPVKSLQTRVSALVRPCVSVT